MTGKELEYIAQAHANYHLAGDGLFTEKCQEWLESFCGVQKALLTNSCTAALEMTALLASIKHGDEIIMPSYTFVSTANAFVLQGGVPVFVDIRKDTLNIDESRIEAAITRQTRAIVPVHYAGVACDMESINSIADTHGLLVIEDAAQGMMSSYRGKALGTLGDLGTVSFHETKNIISGEGGALFVNNEKFIERSEIIREKGTNRSRFLRGQVDKYTWQDIGSSFLPSELVAAFLWAQMEEAEAITASRLKSWCYYNELLWEAERKGLLRLPFIPEDCRHNAHMYYVILPDRMDRTRILATLSEKGVSAVFHYIPLHSSPAGQKYGQRVGDFVNTDKCSASLIRLPLWKGIEARDQERVVDVLLKALLAF